MELHEFKKQYVQTELGISEEFGKILSFVDFGNVNYWFERDRQTYDNIALKSDEKLSINMASLKDFLCIFSSDIRFYYGHDIANPGSLKFIQVAQGVFGKNKVFTKTVQKIRHHLETQGELTTNTRAVHHDIDGAYIYLPKCNFDVEISVDAIKVLEHYDTICLLSSDADFLYLAKFLKQKGKKVILIKGGHVIHQLKDVSDLVINAQDIKKHITEVKQKPA